MSNISLHEIYSLLFNDTYLTVTKSRNPLHPKQANKMTKTTTTTTTCDLLRDGRVFRQEGSLQYGCKIKIHFNKE